MQTATQKRIKLQSIQDNEWTRHVYPNEFCVETTPSGTQRICITSSSGYVDLLLALAAALPEPFFVLYILVVPRRTGETNAARYQSNEISHAELKAFFERFEDYLENDGRHHVWAHSPQNSATLVYDNHDVIYCYGPLQIFSAILGNNGFKTVDQIQCLGPHSHCYNEEFDNYEEEALKFFNWTKSPLQPQDDPR
jgi:hypothetical protein